MAKTSDPTTRRLIEMDPAAWLEALGIPVPDPAEVRVIDSNLSTIIPEADRVLRVGGPRPWIEHLELQAGRDLRFPDRAFLYNVVLGYHYEIPVRTTLVLLREAADGADLTGLLERRHRDGTVYAQFRYDVVRIWEQPAERFLQGGLTVLPLAPVADVGPDRLKEVLTRVAERLRGEATPERRDTLWTATKILLSLRYKKAQVDRIVREVSTMSLGIRGIEESWLYQESFQKGKVEGKVEGLLEQARHDLLVIGGKKFGPPDEAASAAIAAIDDRDRLGALMAKVFDVSSWEELLAPSHPCAPARRRSIPLA